MKQRMQAIKSQIVVGYIIPLSDDIKCKYIDLNELSTALGIENTGIGLHVWQRCSCLVAFFPYLWWFPAQWIDSQPFQQGLLRVYTIVAQKNLIKGPFMKVLPGFAKVFTGHSNNLITYVFPQNYTHLDHVDAKSVSIQS